MIDEIDVWHTGTDEELAILAGSPPSLAGLHDSIQCVTVSVEDEGLLPAARPAPRVATKEEVEKGEHLIPGPKTDAAGNPAERIIHPPLGPPTQGRKRLRLNYKRVATATLSPTEGTPPGVAK